MLFLDETSIFKVTNSNEGGLQKALNKTISNIIAWLKANFLLLNFNKTYYLEFRTKNCTDATLDINYFNKPTANVVSGIQDMRLKYKQSWINHLARMDNTRPPKQALNYKP